METEEYDFSLEANHMLSMYEDIIKGLKRNQTLHLVDIVTNKFIYCGDFVRYNKGEKYIKSNIIQIEKENIKKLGLDIKDCRTVSKNFYERLIDTEIKKNDLIISINSRCPTVVVAVKDYPMSCLGKDILIMRIERLSPYYVALYLNSVYGKIQLLDSRMNFLNTTIDINRIKHIKIPVLNEYLMHEYEEEYKFVLENYNNAMDLLEAGNEEMYNKKIKYCNFGLNNLLYCLEDDISRIW